MEQTKSGLGIGFISFDLPEQLVRDNDEVRVSVTTIPDDFKQTFVIHANDMSNIQQLLTLNISSITTKLNIVFRRKSLFENDPIIASAAIDADSFPKHKIDMESLKDSGLKEITMLKFDIYEPIQGLNGSLRNTGLAEVQRTVIGHLNVKLFSTDAFPEAISNKVFNITTYNLKDKSDAFTANENIRPSIAQ